MHLNIVERGGAGPTLIFLHYWGGSSRTWTEVINALPAGCRSVAPDLRGWGQSGAPEQDAYALADFAADVEQLIAERDLRQYVLVGHSMGGKIAQLLASRRPPGLAGLVLVAPSPPTPMALPPEARAVMAAAYDTRASVGMTIDHMLTARPLTAAQRDQVVEDSLSGTPQARAAWPARTSREDISAEVGKIAVPTIVVAGELDKVDPVAVLEAELLPRIPQAALYVLPGSGHLSPLEAPHALAMVIKNFVDTLALA